MAKKERGHVKIYTVTTKATEDFMYRGYSEDAFDKSIDEEPAKIVDDVKDDVIQKEPEPKKPQINPEGQFNVFRSGGMRI